MRYFKFVADTPYCGTENEYFLECRDDITEEELNDYAEQFRFENAESFEYCATGWDDDFETEEDRQSYYEDCVCNYEEITKEEYEEIGE